MNSEDRCHAFGNPQAPGCSQMKLCDDVKTETCLKDGEDDQQNQEFLKMALKEEPEDEVLLCGETSSSISLVDQQNGEPQENPVKEEEPEDQVSLYCEECGFSFINKCEVHGPPRFIPDTPIPMGVSDRARRTLPTGLEVRESGIPNAGLGVFNVGETVPVGVHFGPYEGDLVDRDEAMKSGYSWVKNRQWEEYIDAEREMNANWMRFVNCARNDEENNLVAFQYRGGILYRCCRTIQPGQELLVWYDEEYAKDLRTKFSYLWKKKRSVNVPELSDALFQVCSSSLRPSSCTTQTYLPSGEYQRCQKGLNDAVLPKPGSDCQQIPDTVLLPPEQTKKGIQLCSDCGRTFSDPSNFRKHRRIHTGEKSYLCSECGRSFALRITLKRHQLVHTGEKPYPCSQCGKSFALQITLQRHQRVHTGAKPYPCSECGKNFTNQSGLRTHQRIHSGEKPYYCSPCGRSFTDQSSLKTHQRIHTGEKPYPCSQCGKSFRQQGNLQTHQRIHSGDKPYYCAECGRSFTDRSSLRRHQHNHGRERQADTCPFVT